MTGRRAGAAAALAALAFCASAAWSAPEPDPKPAVSPPVAAPAPVAKPLTPAARPVQVSHGPPLAGGPPAPRRGPCDRLDAAEIPACADQARRPEAQVAEKPPAAPATHKPAVAPPPAAKPKAVAKPPPAKPKPGPLDLIARNPLLAGAAGGGVALLVGLGAWALLARGARRPAAPSQPRGAAPTPFRRDLVLVDPQGQGLRLAGAALTPFAWAGGDAQDHLRLQGDGIAPRHVQFWVADGRLMMRRGSSEPVFLNDRLLKDDAAEVVSTGDRLQLGRAGFTVLID